MCTESIRCYFFTIFCVKQKRFDFLLKIVLISRFNSINLLALLILYRLNATYWYLRSVYLSECVLVFVLLYLIAEHWGNHRYIVSRKICFWGYWKLLYFIIIITIILEINYNKRLWWRLVGWSGTAMPLDAAMMVLSPLIAIHRNSTRFVDLVSWNVRFNVWINYTEELVHSVNGSRVLLSFHLIYFT